MGFLEFIGSLVKVIVMMALWVFGGLFLILLGAAIGMTVQGDIGSVIAFICVLIGMSMMAYAYYKYSHSLHAKKKYYEY
jgi:hypothetical protein